MLLLMKDLFGLMLMDDGYWVIACIVISNNRYISRKVRKGCQKLK